MTFALLTALTVLSAAFVGQMTFLFTSETARRAPLAWSIVPPLVVVLATAGVLALQPGLTLRRRRLVPVPAEAPGAARFAAAVARAGLRRPPLLVWTPDDARGGALAFGRPGRFCVRVSPALLGAARRRPAAFDGVVLHELAHVRGRDVTMTYAAVYSWYVLTPLLAVPLVTAVVARDLSLVPQYAARVAVLAALVYAVRAHLLRRREHDADVRAAGWLGAPERFAALLTGLPAGRRPAWLANHPGVEQRRSVVLAPSALTRPSWLTLGSAGAAVGAGLPLLAELLAALPGWDWVEAERVARVGLCGLLGAVVAAEVVRWARGRPRLSALTLVAPMAALAVGMTLGSLTSLAGTGLVAGSLQQAGAAGLTGLLVAGLGLVLGDLTAALADAGRLADRAIGPAVAVGAVLIAMLADAATAVTTLVAAGIVGPVARELLGVLTATPTWLAAAVVLVACAGAALTRRQWLPTAVVGLGAGLAGGAATLALRARTGPLGADPVDYATTAVWLVVAVAVVAAVALALAADSASGLVAASLAILVGAAGLAWGNAALGRAFPLGGMLHLAAPAALAVGVPAVALAVVGRWVLGVAPRRRFASVLAGSVLGAVGLVAVAVAVVVVPATPGATGPAGGTDAMALYLEADLPLLQIERDTAVFSGQEAEIAPKVSLADDVRTTTLPLFDVALEDAAEIGAYDYVRDDPAVRALHDAYVRTVTAERAAFEAEALAAEDPSVTNDAAFRSALADAQAAYAHWLELYEAAAVG